MRQHRVGVPGSISPPSQTATATNATSWR